MTKQIMKKVMTVMVIVCMVATVMPFMSDHADAASKTKTITYTNTVTNGGKDCKIWAKDIITFKVSNGKIVSKPKVKQQASVASKIIGTTKLAKYKMRKDPKITYKKNSKTATVQTYWVMASSFGIKKLSIECSKNATVTYQISGDGRVKVVKKQSSKFTCFK